MTEQNDFTVKAFHLDLRIQVMTLKALKSFVKELSDFGINTVVMEWEATFPFTKHRIISNRYTYTSEEIKEFAVYCAYLKIDVIPLQQCFGHIEYILRHDRYKNLREAKNDVSQLCPLRMEAAKDLFKEHLKYQDSDFAEREEKFEFEGEN